MAEAQMALLAMQGTKLLIETVLKAYSRQEMTDEELLSAWAAMQPRLGAVSQRIQN